MGRKKVTSYQAARRKKRQQNAHRPSHARIDSNIPSTSAASVQPDSDIPSTSAATVQREQQILPSTSSLDPTTDATSHGPALKRQKLLQLNQATKTSARIAARPHVTYSSQVPTADDPAIVVPQVPSVEITQPQDPMVLVIEQRRIVEHLPRTYFAARLANSEISDSSIGNMDKVCRYCVALLFKSEIKDHSSRICCHNGKISLPPIDVPPFLQNLIESNNQQSKDYLLNIRQYNSALAFASVTADAVHFPTRGPYCYKVHGQIYHSVASLSVPPGHAPRYASLFIIDSGEALNTRMAHAANNQCSADIMESLQQMLSACNPYAQLFRFVGTVAQNTPEVRLNFTLNNAFDKRRYNAPTVEGEIAAVFTSTDGAPPGEFQFVIYYKATGQVTRINNLNPHSDPMCYPLLFPCGDAGWKPAMPHVHINQTATRHTTTQLQYYCYRLAVRNGFNLLHHSGKLFQQYVVDCYCKVEGARIAFIRSHQKELRAESYKGLLDYMLNEQQGFMPGVPVILPSTFIGSPRNMIQSYQDAMSIVSRFGKPDLFATVTCNPKWEEITKHLQPYEQACNRPDLVTRVFNEKLQLLLDDLLKKHVLGVVLANIHVIEFQKRGLPHAHILIILRETDKIRDPTDADSVVCAELPDPNEDPLLHKVVSECMIHGPCGDMNLQAPCMDGNKCSKNFPKEYAPETLMNVDGYPLYRRRNDGKIVQKNDCFLDNRWVVPYNKWLSKKYQAHINVEICSTITSVKYLYKYVYKGHDCAAIRLHANNENNQQSDEIERFINCRYVSPPEAMWRLHERPLYQKSHAIERLPVHLPQEQMVYFQLGEDAQIDVANEKNTKLTAFFELCENNFAARQFLYSEIPEHFVWGKGEWKPRKRFTKTIGRIYTVNPIDRERFSLRLLLLHVKGPTSFDFLKTVDGTLYATFSEAATHLNLLQNDREWFQCLEEASTYQMPTQLRDLFAMICVFCSPNDVPHLWETFKRHIAEDYLRTHDADSAENLALLDIQQIFKAHGRTCEDFGLPTPHHEENRRQEPVNAQEEADKGQTMYNQLNLQQRRIVDEVLSSVQYNAHQSFFIDGPGGTGKTFVYQTLIHTLRGQGKTVLSVAWTGIAAKLLEDGRTAHSVFKFPVPLTETSVSSLRLNSTEAQAIRDAAIIVWDEVSMVTKEALSVLHRLLTDLTKLDVLFGGKIIVFGGDFRQVLPVVRRGNRNTIVEACVKTSPLWPQVARRKLTTNMRAAGDGEFSEWLLKLGNGTLPVHDPVNPDSIKIPKRCYCPPQDLIKNIFGQEPIHDANINNFLNTAILCAKNDDCGKINDNVVQNLLQGESRTYLSFDCVQSQDPQDAQIYPTEFLNSIDPSGLPPHKLTLKVNTIIMLIRNLNRRRGLVNGLRLIVKQLNNTNIVAKPTDSDHLVIIPRIVLTPSDPTMPFNFSRKQFPIKIAFAMTINKSQGQTLDKAGIYLPRPVFTHGQLYVAFSRVKCFDNIKIAIEQTPEQNLTDDYVVTSNIVYKEVL